MRIPDLFTELHRRRVFRALAWYGAAAFGLLQGLAFVAPQFGWPGWVVRAGVVLAIAGVPTVALVTWVSTGGAATATGTRSDALPPWLAPSSWVALAAGGLLAVGVASAWRASTVVAPAEPVRIAVLPFANLSARPEDAGLINGIHSTLLSELGANPSLRIIGDTSVGVFAGTMVDPARIKEDLEAQYLLQGGALLDGDRIQLQVRLVETAGGRQVWDATYSRPLGDSFLLQKELAGALARAMSIAAAPHASSAGAAAVSADAARDYFAALASWKEDKHLIALTALDRALERHPDFALGWSTKARIHASYAGSWAADARFMEHAPLANAAIARAEALQPDLTDALFARAALAQANNQWDQWLRLTRTLVEHRPGDPDALAVYAHALLGVDRVQESLGLVERRAVLDPLNSNVWSQLGNRFMTLSKYPEARAAYQRALTVDPSVDDYNLAYLELCESGSVAALDAWSRLRPETPLGDSTMLLLKGDAPGALQAAEHTYRAWLGNPRRQDSNDWGAELDALQGLAEALAANGRHDEARVPALRLIERFEGIELETIRPWNRIYIVANHLYPMFLVGQAEKARTLIEQLELLSRSSASGIWRTNDLRVIGAKHAALGDIDRALEILTPALARPSLMANCPWAIWRTPYLAAARNDERFRELFRSHGVDVDAPVFDIPLAPSLAATRAR